MVTSVEGSTSDMLDLLQDPYMVCVCFNNYLWLLFRNIIILQTKQSAFKCYEITLLHYLNRNVGTLMLRVTLR